MDELKPCPFCGGEAEHKMYLWGQHTQTGEPIWCYYIYCLSCDAMTDNIFKTEQEAITAWNRRYAPEPKPLTLDELRERDGKPVWCHNWVGKYAEWTVLDSRGNRRNGTTYGYCFYEYGKAWLAYDHPPKEQEAAE